MFFFRRLLLASFLSSFGKVFHSFGSLNFPIFFCFRLALRWNCIISSTSRESFEFCSCNGNALAYCMASPISRSHCLNIDLNQHLYMGCGRGAYTHRHAHTHKHISYFCLVKIVITLALLISHVYYTFTNCLSISTASITIGFVGCFSRFNRHKNSFLLPPF